LAADAVATVKDVPATIAEIYNALAEPCKVPALAFVGVKLMTEFPLTAGCMIVEVAAAGIVKEP
jgi:hypothetical protein